MRIFGEAPDIKDITENNSLIKIKEILKDYFNNEFDKKFIPGVTPVPLMTNTPYGHQEVLSAIESMLSTHLTLNIAKDSKVQQFERGWSSYIGTKNGIMVNSGSSANLLSLFILANPTMSNHIKKDDEIITPAVTWHTTVSPIISIGAVPVLVDISMDDLTIKTDEIEKHINEKTKAIMPVHLLGNPCNMDKIMELANKYNLYVIEDTCEAHGSSFNGNRSGSIGDIGTFSFFFCHHLTTIEGGMIVTNNDEIAELARIMRSQGVIRNTINRKELEEHYNNQGYADIDKSFLFANLGFNLRPTEINGSFGIEQLKKFGNVLDQRIENGKFWENNLRKYEDYFYIPHHFDSGSSWYGFALIVKPDAPFKREDIISHLNKCKIETRPIMAGNITLQPAMKYFKYKAGNLQNADIVHSNGFFWGNHQEIKSAQREYVLECIDQFINKIG